MTWLRTKRPHITAMVFLAVMIASACGIGMRRPDQLAFPEVWVEDGHILIPRAIIHGIYSVLIPLEGYLIVPSTLITYLSVRASFENYALISTLLALIFQGAVVATVATAPTYLRGRFLCATGLVFLPTDPEVYVVPQYTFWWTSLLIVLALVWKENRFRLGRWACILIGGLSSPLVIAISPIFVLRALALKDRSEWIDTGLVISLAVLQAALLITTKSKAGFDGTIPDLSMIIEKFFGYPFSYNNTDAAFEAGGFAILVAVLSPLAYRQARHRQASLLLLGALAATITIAAIRVPLSVSSPFGGGPRYFFFPLALTAFMLLSLVASWRIWGTVPAVILIALAAPASYHSFTRHQEPIRSWSDSAEACKNGGEPHMAIQYDGHRIFSGFAVYTREMCEKASQQSLLRTRND